MHILEQVKQVIAETLNIPSTSITIESSTDNIDSWDSLAQVNLMMALEQTFDITLDVEDFIKLNSVKSIITFLENNIES